MLTLNWNIIWTLVNLLVLFLLLKRLLFKPVMTVMKERQALIDNQMEAARKNASNAAEKLDEAEKILSTSRIRAQEEAARMMETAARKSDQALAETKAEAEKILADNRTQARREREKILAESQTEITSLALAAARKLARASINDETEKELFSELLMKAGDLDVG